MVLMPGPQNSQSLGLAKVSSLPIVFKIYRSDTVWVRLLNTPHKVLGTGVNENNVAICTTWPKITRSNVVWCIGGAPFLVRRHEPLNRVDLVPPPPPFLPEFFLFFLCEACMFSPPPYFCMGFFQVFSGFLPQEPPSILAKDTYYLLFPRLWWCASTSLSTARLSWPWGFWDLDAFVGKWAKHKMMNSTVLVKND